MAETGTNAFVKVGLNLARRLALQPLFQELGASRRDDAQRIADSFWGEFSHPASKIVLKEDLRRDHRELKNQIKEAYQLDDVATEQKFEALKQHYLYMLPPEKQPDDVLDSWYQVIRREHCCDVVQPTWELPPLDRQHSNQDQLTKFGRKLKKLDSLREDELGDCLEELFEMSDEMGPEFGKIFELWLTSNNIRTDRAVLADIGTDFFNLIYQDSSGACLTLKNLLRNTPPDFGPEFWARALEEFVYDDLASYAQWLHGVAQVYSFVHACGYINESELEQFIVALKSNEAPYLEYLRLRFTGVAGVTN